MIKSRFLLAILPGLLAFSAQAQAPARPSVTVPFRIIQDSGQRPIIEAVVNTLPVRLVLHSNAGFSMQLSHRAATEGGVQPLYHLDAFGITQVGKVSSLGRDTALVKRFVVGGAVFDQVPAQVFETPAPYTQGMLGLRWLRANRVVVDYQRKVAHLNPTPDTTQQQRARLLRAGYVAVPMRRDPADGRYLVTVTVRQTPLTLEVSTVSDNRFDLVAARQLQLRLVDTGGTYGGPTGTTGKVYRLAKPLPITLSGHPYVLKSVGSEDLYAYAAKTRPTDPAQLRSGTLGADFLLDRQAVVDFGNAVLYLRK